jgi:putative ABC transport system permease protein
MLLQDLRHGARSLRRSPGFTAVAVIALALGIGANTAVFSVVNAVLLRPLAYRDPGRLVTLLHGGSNPVAVANYLDWRDQSRSFETMAAADYWRPNLTGIDSPEHLYGLKVTGNLLPMLGIQPLLGRLFVRGEDEPGAEHETILSYGLWQRRFNGDPGVLGRLVTLDGEGYRVVGVMPQGFHFAPFWATRAELWVPDAFAAADRTRGGNHLRVFARLKSGVSLDQARAEIRTVTARLERQYPGTNRNVRVTPLRENVVGKVETPLLILLGAVGLVLLIACANVAHMLLARASSRRKELAVRGALGAGRARIAAQLLTENLLLAVLGGAAGLVIASWGTRALRALSPANLPRVDSVAIDGWVALFLIAATLATGLIFGLVPALRVSSMNLAGALKDAARGSSESFRRNRLRGALVASEFALALVLLIGAGLMVRSFFALRAVDPGFRPDHVISMVVSVAGSPEADAGRREVFYRQLLDRVRALPGVEAAGGINHLPLAGDLWGWSFTIAGRPKPNPGEAPGAVYRIIMPGYLETMRLPVLRGRGISERDDSGAPGVVLINERAAARYWPGEDPLGKQISFDGHNWITIAGIVKNAKQGDWADEVEPEVYLPALQNRAFLEDPGVHFAYLTLVARTVGDPAALAPALKQAVWSFDRNLPVSEVLTMDRVVADATAAPRFEMLLLGVFATIALVLAAVGIYGVMSYSVARRTQEIGIRVSLGATRRDVLAMVVRQAMALVLAGAAVGLAGSLMLARLMSGMLYGVRPADPLTFAVVALLLAAVALAAAAIPALRATRIDPLVALREVG